MTIRSSTRAQRRSSRPPSAPAQPSPAPSLCPPRRRSSPSCAPTHKYKDSREQFERRTHKRLIDISNSTPKTVEALMALDLPAGVEIEIKL